MTSTSSTYFCNDTYFSPFYFRMDGFLTCKAFNPIEEKEEDYLEEVQWPLTKSLGNTFFGQHLFQSPLQEERQGGGASGSHSAFGAPIS